MSDFPGYRLRFADDSLREYFAARGPETPLVGSERRGRLAFAHDSLGPVLAAFAVTEQQGIRRTPGRAVGEGEIAVLAPWLDEALDQRLRPEFGALVLAILQAGDVAAGAVPWLELFQGKLTHRLQGEHRAEPFYTRAHASIRDRERRAWLSLTLGTSHVSHSMDVSTALHYLQEAERTYRELGKMDQALQARVMILAAHSLSGTFAEQARSLDPEALITADREASAERLLRLGILYRQNWLLPEALRALQRSRKLLRATGNVVSLAESNIALGDTYRALHRWQEAASCYEAAFHRLATQTGEGQVPDYRMSFHRPSAHLGMARAVLFGREDVATALHHSREALNGFTALGVRHHQGVAWSVHGRCLRAAGRWSEASAAYEQALVHFRGGGEHLQIIQSLRALLWLDLRTGRLRPAVGHLGQLAQALWDGRSMLLHRLAPAARLLLMRLHPPNPSNLHPPE